MANKGRRFLTESYTTEEVESMLAKFNPRYSCPTRNKALMVVMWRCGLRISEALDLMPGDVEDGLIHVRHGRGGTARTVSIDSQCKAVLQAWLDRKAKLGIGGPIFSTLKGTRLSANYVREAVPRTAKKAGITKRMHPQGFRQSFVSGSMFTTRPLDEVLEATKHRTVATMTSYTIHPER